MGTLQATHFWDCNGMACDAPTIQPWDMRKYKAAPQYSPMDPEHYGGAKYGEKLWMTGAASDALSDALGPDSDCCGVDNQGGGGCGKCLLVQNPTSANPGWTAVIMKKNRCPPNSNGCDKPHFDLAVPGFDHLGYSTANVCGSPDKDDTYINKEQTSICGAVPPLNCNCLAMPGNTAAQRRLRDGCLMFKQWGWHHGTPQLNYKPVACPENFIEQVKVGAAFGRDGVMGFYDNSSISSALHEVAAAGTGPSARLGVLLCFSLIALMIGGGIFAGIRRRSVFQVHRLLDSKVTDSEDIGQ